MKSEVPLPPSTAHLLDVFEANKVLMDPTSPPLRLYLPQILFLIGSQVSSTEPVPESSNSLRLQVWTPILTVRLVGLAECSVYVG